MEQNIKFLKKQIIFRASYTGTKETDLIYKKNIINKINQFNLSELQDLSFILETISDHDICLILTRKLLPKEKYKTLFNKILND